MKKLLFLCLFLTSCMRQQYRDACQKELIEMKQQLVLAQNRVHQENAYITHLEKEIAKNEIELIQKEIAAINQQIATNQLSHDEWLTLFHEQRETLNRIIQMHPECRLKAQDILDEILTLITQLSDRDINLELLQ